MIPVLFAIGNVKIYTMGIFVVLGFLWSLFILWKTIRLTSFREEDVFDIVFFGILGGTIFGRVVYVLLRQDLFGLDLLKIILINGYPGISTLGSLGGFFLTGIFVSRIKKIPHKEIFDHIICALYVFGIFFSLGGFLSGSLVGSKTNFLFSVSYAGIEGKRHLLGLYMAIFSLVGALSSYRLLFELRRREGKKGLVFMYGIWFFSLMSLLLDKLKDDTLYLFGLRFETAISVLIFLFVSLYLIRLNRVAILKTVLIYEKKIVAKTKNFFERKTSIKKNSK